MLAFLAGYAPRRRSLSDPLRCSMAGTCRGVVCRYVHAITRRRVCAATPQARIYLQECADTLRGSLRFCGGVRLIAPGGKARWHAARLSKLAEYVGVWTGLCWQSMPAGATTSRWQVRLVELTGARGPSY